MILHTQRLSFPSTITSPSTLARSCSSACPKGAESCAHSTHHQRNRVLVHAGNKVTTVRVTWGERERESAWHTHTASELTLPQQLIISFQVWWMFMRQSSTPCHRRCTPSARNWTMWKWVRNWMMWPEHCWVWLNHKNWSTCSRIFGISSTSIEQTRTSNKRTFISNWRLNQLEAQSTRDPVHRTDRQPARQTGIKTIGDGSTLKERMKVG